MKKTLDSLTNAATAFRTWAELMDRVLNHGYAPTLSRSKKSHRKLADAIQVAGGRVFMRD